jgi:hypothetical protein
MLIISELITNRIKEFYNMKIEQGFDCRILLPGLTNRISKEIHQALLDSHIKSYFIVNNKEEADGFDEVILPGHLTSLRKGSFISICNPGTIPFIHDSIKGTGGTIKDIALDDDWPWDSKESDFFGFDSMYSEWLQKTGIDFKMESCSSAMINILDVLKTWNKEERNQFFFEHILDIPSSDLSYNNDFEKLLHHWGLINTRNPIENINDYFRSVQKMYEKARDNLDKGEINRASILSNYIKLDEHFKEEISGEGINALIDEFSIIDKSNLDVFCLKDFFIKTDNHWKNIDDQTFKHLFDIPEDRNVDLKLLSYEIIDRDIQTIAIEKKTILCEYTESISIKVKVNIDDVEQANLKVTSGSTLISSHVIGNDEEKVVTFKISDSFSKPTKPSRRMVQLSVTDDSNNLIGNRQTFYLVLWDNSLPGLLCLLNKEGNVRDYYWFTETDVDAPDTDSRIDVKISERFKLICFVHNIEINQKNKENTSESPQKQVQIVDEEDLLGIEASSEIKEFEGSSALLKFGSHNKGISPLDTQSGSFIIELSSGSSNLLLNFISDTKESGFYNFIDEVVFNIERKGGSVEELIDCFENTSLYAGLGSIPNKLALQREITLAIQESPYPISIITDNNLKITRTETSSGLTIYSSPDITTQHFMDDKIDDEGVIKLIENYSIRRKTLIDFIEETFLEEHDTKDRPLYALVPFYAPKLEKEIFEYVEEFLAAYILLQEYNVPGKHINKYIASYLDTIVLWQEDKIQSVLLGPYHPLNIVGYIFTLKHLFTILQKKEDNRFDYEFNNLVSLILKLDYYKWFKGYNPENDSYRSYYIFSTNNFHFKYGEPFASDHIDANALSKKSKIIDKLLAISINSANITNSENIYTYCSNFIKSWPQKRSLKVRITNQYDLIKVFDQLRSNIYKDLELTQFAKKIPGGIHVYTETEEEELNLFSHYYDDECPICFYHVPANESEENKYDIKLLSPIQRIFLTDDAPVLQIRGKNENSIVVEQITRSSVHSDGRPALKIFEFDNYKEISDESIYNKLIESIRNHHSENITQIVIDLPTQIDSKWIILPGLLIDPRIISTYLIEHTDITLWDYKLKFDQNLRSYFVLSGIPPTIINKLSNYIQFDGDNSKMEKLLTQASYYGVGIGNEAFSTERKARGVVGLLCAISVFDEIHEKSPINSSENSVGLIVPVDSFTELLGRRSDSSGESRYSDLVAIQLRYVNQKLCISFTSIECKYSLSDYTNQQISEALDQSKETTSRFTYLLEAAQLPDGILERVALKTIIGYAIRIKREQVDIVLYRNLMNCLIDGNISYVEAKYANILVVLQGTVPSNKIREYPGGSCVLKYAVNEFPFEGNTYNEIETLYAKIEDCSEEDRSETNYSEQENSQENIATGAIENPSSEEVPINTEADNDIKEIEYNEAPSLDLNKISNAERKIIINDLYNTLKAHKIKIEDKPIDEFIFIEAPAFFKLELAFKPGFKMKQVTSILNEISQVLKLKRAETPRFYQDEGKWWLEVPKKEDQKVKVTTEYIWSRFTGSQKLKIPVGVDTDGNTVSINLSSSNSPHILIGGMTGSGKSVLLETIIRGAVKFYNESQLELYMVDPKGNELIEFQEFPHTKKPNGETPEDAILLLESAVNEMESRYELFKNLYHEKGKVAKDIIGYNQLSEKEIPRWLIIIDEYADLVEADQDLRNDIESLMRKLSAKARAAGIHIIVATQRPSGDIINTTVRANLPGKIALKVDSAVNSRIILDENGAETLGGKGEALLRGDNDEGLIRIQCAIYNGDNT